jgi:pimeloyl-ACP methyl ester carboxylesterase
VFGHAVDTAALSGMPTPLLQGDRDLVARVYDVVPAALPHARLTQIPGGTDFANKEFPEAFAEELAAFVRRTRGA